MNNYINTKIKSILLIDDDEVVNFMNQLLLSNLGYSGILKSCSNGIEALNYINECIDIGIRLPDIILLDASMPMMNAFQFLDVLKEKKGNLLSSIKIYILSGYQNEDLEKSFDDYEIEKILEKPLTEKKIKTILYNGK